MVNMCKFHNFFNGVFLTSGDYDLSVTDSSEIYGACRVWLELDLSKVEISNEYPFPKY